MGTQRMCVLGTTGARAGLLLAGVVLLALLVRGCSDDDGASNAGDTGDTGDPGDTGDTGDPGDPGDTGDTGDLPTDGDPATVDEATCNGGPVTPIALDDATYDEIPTFSCYSDACLCSEGAQDRLTMLLRCEPIDSGFFYSFGSLAFRTVGRADGACLVDFGLETEGAVGLAHCAIPLPMEPWPGLSASFDESLGSFLDGIGDYCESGGGCCVLQGCPNPCSEAPELNIPGCGVGGTPCQLER